MRSPNLITALILASQLTPTLAAERPKRPPPAVTAYEVKQAEMPQTYISTGTLVANQQAELRTEVSGRVSKLHVSAGERLVAGTPLLSIDSRSAQAEIQRLESQLSLARQQLERQRSLMKKAAGAAEKVDIQSAEVSGLEANLRIARLALERYELLAPFSGVLGNFDWVEGGWITTNEPFTTLDDTSKLKVNFDIPERFLRFIELGREVELESAAWSEQRFIGQISLIEARMNAQRATLGVQALVDNSDGLLLPGMRVSVSLRVDDGSEKLVVPARSLIHEGDRTSLRVDDGSEKLVVPARSLIHEGDRTTVLRLDSESKAKPTVVQLGQETSEWVEVVDGLTIGDRIVDRGLVKAKPNRPVKVLGDEPAENARGGEKAKGQGGEYQGGQRQRPDS